MVVDIFIWFVLIGFLAQLVDGTLGMAYGVVSTSSMIAMGVPPAIASANVHSAEVFTTAASGISHAAAGNVDWQIFWRLALFGSAGGAVGAVLVSLADTDMIRPFIAAYLFAMGVVVIWKGLRPVGSPPKIGRVRMLGFLGGAADAIGGGGWGPVVASNLIARGGQPSKMVGTVNLAEFFVTLAVSITFLLALGPNFGKAAAGLLVGGVVAAPIAAFAAKRVPRKALTILVGAAICLVSAYNLYRYLH
ncbi:sulfite exporter TauE/SafE family protein [Hyphomonas sp.]|uniref:sulfite exporter TauE/SafE family protein n=1 Tax=Hyphomonas sp. TaxID=87 RepID=UPI0025B8DA86|nr:sulfite exporter TauE/SafE family protein [Hyphomonas sp.]